MPLRRKTRSELDRANANLPCASLPLTARDSMRSRPAPDLQERSNAARAEHGSAAQAVGALALGAVALGAIALGAVAIGRLAIDRARIRRLEIDELVVRNVRVLDALEAPTPPAAEN